MVGLWVVGVAVDELNADLLGQGQLDLLAVWSGKLSDALLDGFGGVLDLWDGDALVLSDVFAADAGQQDGFVDAGLDGLGVSDGDVNVDGGNDGHVVLGLLGDFVAVVVAVGSVSVAGGLADGHHLDVVLLLEGHLDGLGGGGFLLLLVAVRADLILDFFDGLGADGPGHVVAEFLVHDLLDGQVHVLADGLKGWGAHFGDLGHVLNGAVVLGLLVAAVVWGGLVVGWGVAVSRGGLVVGRGVVAVSRSWLVVAAVSRGVAVGLGGDGVSQGQESQDSGEGLEKGGTKGG